MDAVGPGVEVQDTSPHLVPRLIFEQYASNAKYSPNCSVLVLDGK
jgi:hypothetical protein